MALSAVIEETALRAGPPELVMEQPAHLLDVGGRPHVKVRVIPTGTGRVLVRDSKDPSGAILTFAPAAWAAFVATAVRRQP